MSNVPKVLVTRRQFKDQVNRLAEVSEVIHLERPSPPSRTELKRYVENCAGIFAHITDSIDAEIMDAAGKNLKIIAEFGVGYDNINVVDASNRNIAVANTPGILTETAADFAFTVIQSAARRIAESDRYVRNGNWKWFDPLDLLGLDINGSILGIVVFGRIGGALAKKALGSGMKVVYFSRSKPKDDYGCKRLDSLDELLQTSDFVSLHCPLTDATKGLIGEKELLTMQSHSVLINTARGPIVDTNALTEALLDKQISYAALDVTDPEPIPTNHKLLSLDNVTILPHIASATVGTRRKMSEMTVDNIISGIHSKIPPHCVNVNDISW